MLARPAGSRGRAHSHRRPRPHRAGPAFACLPCGRAGARCRLAAGAMRGCSRSEITMRPDRTIFEHRYGGDPERF
jgi:hypothetical protein